MKARPFMKFLGMALFGLSPGLLSGIAAAQGLGSPPVPPENPITPEKALLGKALFWDEQLSSTRSTSCGTCHIPSQGMSDPRSALPNARRNPGPDGQYGTDDDKIGSPGVIRSLADGRYVPDSIFGLHSKVGIRKSMSFVNAGFLTNMFWDGRVDDDKFFDPIGGGLVLTRNATLENVIIEPPLNELEMSHDARTWTDVQDRVQASTPLALATNLPPDLHAGLQNKSYPDLFQDAFGSSEVSASKIIMAIATYGRTLQSDETPFDKFLEGDNGAMTDAQKRGFEVFQRSFCSSCHIPPLLTDDLFRNTGVRPKSEDRGRGGHTGNPAEDGMFRTAPLRNVGLREPLFHHGQMATIEDVVEFYDRGGDFPKDDFSDRLVFPLGLTDQEKADLADFLRNGLTDTRVAQEEFPFDRPMLYTESDRVPREVAPGQAGSGGIVPRMVLEEPPLLGNPSLTVAVDQGLGGAQALLYVAADISGTVLPIALPFGPLDGSGAGAGWGSMSLPIPTQPILDGARVLMRWIVFDTGGGASFAASETYELRFFSAP